MRTNLSHLRKVLKHLQEGGTLSGLINDDDIITSIKVIDPDPADEKSPAIHDVIIFSGIRIKGETWRDGIKVPLLIELTEEEILPIFNKGAIKVTHKGLKTIIGDTIDEIKGRKDG